MTNWTEEQRQAIDKRNSNILVSASAGSGKTAVLVERIIQKVVNEYLDIDKILVVTFTNAAAQELKEKILNAIYKALENEKDSKKRNHLKNQLIYINRASITTIDAFCFKLVKENFNELEIDPNIRICEESQSILIKTRILEDLLEKEYESAPESKDVFGLYNILELFNGKDEDLLSNILKIYNYIQAFPRPFEWLREQIEKYNVDENVDLINTDFGKDIYDEIIDELKLCILKCEEIESKIQSQEDFNKHFFLIEEDLAQIKRCVLQENNSWDKLYENINSIVFNSFPRNKVSDIELKDEIKEIRDKEIKAVIEKCKKKIYAKSNEILEDNRIGYQYMSYLYNFLLSFDTVFKKEKKELSIAEFNDIMHYAIDLVLDKDGNPTEIANSLQTRFKEIYTDEYQDTSYLQEALLQAISREDNRFMVGDIKQSIYGFRQARPDIFNEKYIAYKRNNECTDEDKESKIILAQNFRSRHEVIDSINYIFEKIMSMKNGECNYTDDETLKCGNKSYVESENTSFKTEINIINLKEQEFLPMIGEEEEDDSYEIDENLSNIQIEAKCIAYKIQDIIANSKVMGKDGTLRTATYKDIVILTRSVKNKAQVYEEVLKEQNIPVFADTSASIFEGDETKLILSFLRILDNPYQDIYLISIMYSIIGSFTLDDIARIRLYNSKDYVYDTLLKILEDENFKEEYNEIYEKVEKFVKLIEDYIRYSKIYSISDLLIRLYKDTNIYYQFAIEESGASKKANLDYLIELANAFVSQIGNTLNSYIRYVDNLKDKQDGSSSAKIIGENEDVVRIMTIHKSKGLEFPIVILADTTKKYNLNDVYREKVQMHHKYGIGIDIVNQEYGVTYPSVIKQAIKSVIEKDLKSEEIRLLYVALTRAKEKLYIFSTTKDYDKDYEKQSINVKEGKFNETMIASNDSYYKNLLPVIKWYKEYETEKKVLNIVKIDVKSDTTDDNLKELLGVKEVEDKRYSVSDIIDKIKKNSEIKIDEEKLEKIRNNLESEYKYKEDALTPARVSVSALKTIKTQDEETEEQSEIVVNEIEEIDEKYVDEEIDEEAVKEAEKARIAKKFKLPKTIRDESEYTAVRKGILIHFILQNLDFNIEDKRELKNFIDNLVEINTISKEDRKYISVNRIYNFLNSNIGKELKNAKNIYREYEFVLENEKISRSLILGVIDLFYITNDGKVVLVDFKTDKLENNEDFIKKYKKQLDIYKEAINTLTEKKVDETYIYSFNLNKSIKLED